MKILMVIAQENYHPIEYGAPKKVFEEAGMEVVTASKKVGTCTDKEGGTTEATVSIEDVNVSNYDAVVFVGGSGARNYQHDVQAHLTAQEALNRDKVLAAICIAPTILAYAGVLDGKKATVHTGDGVADKTLTEKGATYTGESVTVDGKIVTANGPEAAEEFAKKVLEVLKR